MNKPYKTDRNILNKKRMVSPQGPLVGIRVIDFSQVLASPYLGAMLSDMGAEVIKIEAPYGDQTRALGPVKEGEVGYFIVQNHGKYDLCLDFANPKSIEICKELIKVGDVVIENWRPGVMTRRGLGYAAVRELNKGIVYASVSGFGNFDFLAPAPGPYSKRLAYDVIVQGEAAHQWMNGYPDDSPMALDTSWSDMITAAHQAVAIAAALIHRNKTGRGQWIDVSLSDSMISSNENYVCMTSMADEEVLSPCRNGMRRLSVTPYGVFRAKDDWLVVGVDNNVRFSRLCKAMGRPELIKNVKFNTNEHRLQNRREIEEIVENWCAEKTVDECVKILRDEHAVPAGHILSNTDYVQHHHFKSRDMIVPIEQTRAGIVEVPGVVPKLSKTPGKTQGAAPLLGEHNRYILKKYLGYSDRDVDKLYDDIVIVDNIDMEYTAGHDIAKIKAKEKGGILK